MQEELVSFQVAKLAKEKGFNIGCDHYFTLSLTEKIHKIDGTSGPFGWKEGELHTEVSYFVNNHSKIDYSNSNWFMCARPSQSLLQKWLREVHRIYVYIKPIHNLDINGSMLDNWEICIEDFMGRKSLEESIYIHGYEEALEKGLQEALKLIE